MMTQKVSVGHFQQKFFGNYYYYYYVSWTYFVSLVFLIQTSSKYTTLNFLHQMFLQFGGRPDTAMQPYSWTTVWEGTFSKHPLEVVLRVYRANLISHASISKILFNGIFSLKDSVPKIKIFSFVILSTHWDQTKQCIQTVPLTVY